MEMKMMKNVKCLRLLLLRKCDNGVLGQSPAAVVSDSGVVVVTCCTVASDVLTQPAETGASSTDRLL